MISVTEESFYAKEIERVKDLMTVDLISHPTILIGENFWAFCDCYYLLVAAIEVCVELFIIPEGWHHILTPLRARVEHINSS